MGGTPTEAHLQFAGMSSPFSIRLQPYAIKTLRLDPDGCCREVDLISEL
jgi:hypothetical protein